ncbi:MAG: rhamnulokinase [Verrucomicrobia bacterium]|nr:rhamnulokinase [Verrucomicrobiota bacterium]
MSDYLAIDLGAESGRVILGRLRNGRLSMKEVHRFSNGAITANGTLRWDIIRIFREIRVGLARGAKLGRIKSVACDSWGVDYVLLKGDGPLLSLPFTYRDERSFKSYELAMCKFSEKQLFEGTGIASISINTLYQLLDDARNRPELLKMADKFLLIGDYVNFLLTGVARAEETLISGSQCWDVRRRDWARPVLRKLGIPLHLLPKPVAPGVKLGKLRPYLAAETGLRSAHVVTTCVHDTAAAVAAVPARPGKDWAYLSSGTWSLLGVELDRPVVSETVRKARYTNEVGFGGTSRFLKNLVGLWILQECRREWMERGEVSDYGEIVRLALQTPSLRSFIRPDDPRFTRRGDMVAKVQAFCRETRQPVPRTHGEIARCVLESLALLYRVEMDALERLTGRRLAVLHIVGGGSRNGLLNQATADATGRTVVTGPVEATAAGNILIQAVAMKELRGLKGVREVMRKSFPCKNYLPRANVRWGDALRRFKSLKRA